MRIFQKCLLSKIALVTTLLCSYIGNAEADIVVNAHAPVISKDGLGNFVAVWEALNLDTGKSVIQSSNYVATRGTWSDPVTISNSAQVAFDPQISMNIQGNALAIWASSDGFLTWLQGNNLTLGGTWGQYKNISTTSDLVYTDPGSYSLQIDATGNIFVAWTSEDVDSGLSKIQASTANFGGGWTTKTISGTSVCP